MSDNTIFDDVFRTMLEKMPRLIIPVINEVFHTSYSENDPIEQYRNEHHTKSGEVITDSYLNIKGMLYHIECQSSPDSHMIIRMIEYDFAIALDNPKKEDGVYEINFPHSCVLYLRQNAALPDELQLKVKLPDSTSFLYKVPAVQIQNYTKDEIFQKRLLFFLPFYIMRYEKSLKEISGDPERISKMVDEFQDIQHQLLKTLSGDEEADLYRRILELMKKISDYMLDTVPESVLKERIGGTMGGKVLELETDKIMERSFKQGIEQGIERGIEQGIERGIEQTVSAFVTRMLRRNMPLEDIISCTGCSQEEILRIKEQAENQKDLCSPGNDFNRSPPKRR